MCINYLKYHFKQYQYSNTGSEAGRGNIFYLMLRLLKVNSLELE